MLMVKLKMLTSLAMTQAPICIQALALTAPKEHFRIFQTLGGTSNTEKARIGGRLYSRVKV